VGSLHARPQQAISVEREESVTFLAVSIPEDSGEEVGPRSAPGRHPSLLCLIMELSNDLVCKMYRRMGSFVPNISKPITTPLRIILN
jgi:hypothetical protein